MRVFQQSDRSGSRWIVVVGEGLLGGALSDRLRRRGVDAEAHRATDWSANPEELGADLATLLGSLPSNREELEIFWTAGEAGMGLPDFDHARHRGLFTDRLDALVAQASGSARIHLASSAGALGAPGSTPLKDRTPSPYAERKWIEEEVVRSRGQDHRIHRITSAYGAPRPGGRAGVIGLLLRNALLGKETELFARPSTMRNYVHHHDVAEAMIRSLDEPTEPDVLLAAHRSHTMTEVLSEVSRIVRRAVPVIHRPPANDHDMVFDPTAASPLLPQRSLAAGVRSTYDALMAR